MTRFREAREPHSLFSYKKFHMTLDRIIGIGHIRFMERGQEQFPEHVKG